MAKLSKKEIEQPDHFITAMDAFQAYIKTHRMKFLICLGALIVVMVVGLAWYLYDKSIEKEAQKLYSTAYSTLAQINRNLNDPTAKSKVSEVIKAYDDLIAKYPGTKAALIARYDLGNLYFWMNEIDKAIKDYDEFISRTREGNDLRNFAYSGLGYCYENKKDYSKALDMFQKALQSKEGTSFAGIIYYEIAAIYEIQGKKAEALKQYHKALEQKNDSLLEALIKRKIAELS